MTKLALIAMTAVVCCLPLLARADWDPGDPAKWTQMPDMDGWDVNVTDVFLADDFLCTETGFIDEIHFWGSWRGDLKGTIQNIRVEIWADDPDDDGTGPDYSKPGSPRWGDDFGPSRITERDWGEGSQGWFDPVTGEATPQENWPDHLGVYQYNLDLTNLPGYFEQQQGEIYWLLIKVTIAEGGDYAFGWKTSDTHWNDDAVYDATPDVWPPDWQKLVDPRFAAAPVSLDLAFVLNSTIPEPGVLALIVTAAAGLLAWRRTKRH
jgi:hypothetical protein